MRRIIAAVVIVIVIVLILIGVSSCSSSANKSALESYTSNVNSLIRQSQSNSVSLFKLLTSGVSSSDAVSTQNEINKIAQNASDVLSSARKQSVPSAGEDSTGEPRPGADAALRRTDLDRQADPTRGRLLDLLDRRLDDRRRHGPFLRLRRALQALHRAGIGRGAARCRRRRRGRRGRADQRRPIPPEPVVADPHLYLEHARRVRRIEPPAQARARPGRFRTAPSSKR